MTAGLTLDRLLAGRRGLALAALLSALTVLEIMSQYHRRMPAWQVGEKSLVSSDTLANIDLVRQVASGEAALGEWVSGTASFWLTEVLPVAVLMAATGGNWLFTLALYGALMCLFVTWSLAVVVRLASGLPRLQCWFAAALAVALVVVLVRLADSWSGNFGLAQRPFNIAAFFFACAGLAKVAAGGKASVPLTWAYLACCLFFGASDGLLGFHVALPVFVASLWWLFVTRSVEARKIAAYAFLGMALVLLGFWANGKVSPLSHNVTTAPPVFVWLFTEEPELADKGIWARLVRIVRTGHHNGMLLWVDQALAGKNWLNNYLALSLAALGAWAFLARWRRKAAANPGDIQACVRTLLVAMLWTLAAGCLVVIFVFYPVERYAWPMFWAPSLSLAALAVAWAIPGAGNARPARKSRRLRRQKRRKEARWQVTPDKPALALSVVVAALLAGDLVFFRPSGQAAAPVACSMEFKERGGLGRGMTAYWLARESSYRGGGGDLKPQILYYAYKGYLFEYPHVGSMRHTEGKADYIVTKQGTDEADIAHGLFSLPARMMSCGGHSYLLYGKDALDSARLQRFKGRG